LKKNVIVALTVLLMLSLTFTATISTVKAQGPVTGPYVDQLTFYATSDESKALGDISAGLTDIYLWRVPIDLRDRARADPNVQTVTGFGGYLSLVFNPAPTAVFNPFSIEAVRQAMQYLIDRDYIVNVIHKGDASPKIFCYGRYDADYAYVADLAEALLTKYAYSFDKANQTVTSALVAAGATKDTSGKWNKDGAPITIKGFIRIDDPIRKSIGDLLAADLEKMGFTVERVYGDLNKAYDVVYGSDPKEGKWHFYTEGWRAGALTKYDTGALPQMYCPYVGYMPGWTEPSFWNYANATLDSLGQRFAGGNFTSLDDRASIMRRILQMAFQESVRIFIADQLELYPSSARFPPFAYELAVATATPFAFYTVRLPDGDPARRSDGTGGSLKIAQKLMYQGAYNPIGGFSDVYSVNIYNIVSDPGVWPNPHTGVYMPIRAPFAVQTAGPTGKMSVPADAETWDYVHHKWATVDSGTQAVSNVTFNFKLSNWHDGVMMTPADIRYALYMSLEWSTQGEEGANDTRFDSYYAGAETTWVQNFVGIKFVNDSAVQVYTNYWFPDDGQIAAFSNVFPTIPWEVYYVSERVVLANQARYSTAEAKAINVPWLDFVAPDAGLPQMKANLTQMQAGNLLPDAGKDGTTGAPLPYFDSSNRTSRYDALQAWVTAHNHFFVSNGPFYFDTTDRVAGQDVLKAFRDTTYPFKPGDWNYLIPVDVPSVTTEAPSSIVIGKDALINVKIAIGGVPSSAADVVYLIFDSAANVVLSGRATPTSITGTFQVALTSNQTATFNPGGYSIKIIAYSRSVTLPKFDSQVFTALPPYEEIIGADIARLSTDLSSVKSDVTDLGTTTSDIQTRVTGLEGTIATLTTVLYVALILLIASIVVSVVVIFFVRKKK
jgi:peptide/nickel transport system substrate-binding protein